MLVLSHNKYLGLWISIVLISGGPVPLWAFILGVTMDDGPTKSFKFFFIFIEALEINIRRTTLISTSTSSLGAFTISSIIYQ